MTNHNGLRLKLSEALGGRMHPEEDHLDWLRMPAMAAMAAMDMTVDWVNLGSVSVWWGI